MLELRNILMFFVSAVPSLCLFMCLLHRKNWSQSWTVLHGGILTFHKDPKSAPTGNAVRTNYTYWNTYWGYKNTHTNHQDLTCVNVVYYHQPQLDSCF